MKFGQLPRPGMVFGNLSRHWDSPESATSICDNTRSQQFCLLGHARFAVLTLALTMPSAFSQALMVTIEGRRSTLDRGGPEKHICTED